MLKAFLDQSKIDPEAYNQTEEYHNTNDPGYWIARRGPGHRVIIEKGGRQDNPEGEKRFKDAWKEFGKSSDLRANTNIVIPSKITAEDISQTTESHPNFKKYDHSLENVRNIVQ